MDKQDVLKNTRYQIKGNSEYFLKKYGTSSPIIKIEDEHHKVFDAWWVTMMGNWACELYRERQEIDDLPKDNPDDKTVFYGHVRGMGELVHASELEEIGDEPK